MATPATPARVARPLLPRPRPPTAQPPEPSPADPNRSRLTEPSGPPEPPRLTGTARSTGTTPADRNRPGRPDRDPDLTGSVFPARSAAAPADQTSVLVRSRLRSGWPDLRPGLFAASVPLVRHL